MSRFQLRHPFPRGRILPGLLPASLGGLLLGGLLLGLLLSAQTGVAATFVTNAAQLAVGKSVTSATSKNGNRTRFYFSNVVANPETKANAAFLQWAPLVPKARGYKNGTLIDQHQPLRLWINGIWYTVTFDGAQLRIR